MTVGSVETVKGSIDTGGLGRTLMHEHVFVLSPEMLVNYPDEWDEEERVADAIAKLNDLKAHGVDSIVDPTVIGLGRYIPRLQRIAGERHVLSVKRSSSASPATGSAKAHEVEQKTLLTLAFTTRG